MVALLVIQEDNCHFY